MTVKNYLFFLDLKPCKTILYKTKVKVAMNRGSIL